MRCYLGGALVAAGLEADDAVPALADLLVGEVPLVLGGHLGAEGGAGVLGVVLGGATWARLIGFHNHGEGPNYVGRRPNFTSTHHGLNGRLA